MNRSADWLQQAQADLEVAEDMGTSTMVVLAVTDLMAMAITCQAHRCLVVTRITRSGFYTTS